MGKDLGRSLVQLPARGKVGQKTLTISLRVSVGNLQEQTSHDLFGNLSQRSVQFNFATEFKTYWQVTEEDETRRQLSCIRLVSIENRLRNKCQSYTNIYSYSVT